MPKAALIYEDKQKVPMGTGCEMVLLGEEYIIVGIEKDMTHTVRTTVKWTSLPFFLLRVLASVIAPEKEEACSG